MQTAANSAAAGFPDHLKVFVAVFFLTLCENPFIAGMVFVRRSVVARSKQKSIESTNKLKRVSFRHSHVDKSGVCGILTRKSGDNTWA